MNLSLLCKELTDLVAETGNYIREENKKLDRSGIEAKGKNDYVTYVDKASEKKLIEGLSLLLPGCGFLTEEGTVDFKKSEYVWIIDPLDGTTNYIHHLPPYAVSVGLMHEEKIILGCVYIVPSDEMFSAWKGGKAWLNGEEIHVSSQKEIDGGLIAYGIPYNLELKYEFLRKKMIELFGRTTLRHMGSAASEICYVASGRTDAYFHDNLKPWDVAAGSLILKEAGGRVTDLRGGDDYIFGREFVASNGNLHDELLNFLKEN